jgi:hypothetical protein
MGTTILEEQHNKQIGLDQIMDNSPLPVNPVSLTWPGADRSTKGFVSLGRLLLVDGVRLGANLAMSSGCLWEMSKLCSSALSKDSVKGSTDLGAVDC